MKCYEANQQFDGVGMVMRLGADGPSSTSRTSQSMAPIVFLGLNNLFICVHNRANPNEIKRSNMSHHSAAQGPTDICGDMCNLSEEASIGLSSLYQTPTWMTVTIAQKKIEGVLSLVATLN